MLPQQAIMVKEYIRRIDTHARVFAASSTLAPGARCLPAREARVEEWLALQDVAGVTHAVLETCPARRVIDNFGRSDAQG